MAEVYGKLKCSTTFNATPHTYTPHQPTHSCIAAAAQRRERGAYE